MKGSSNILYRYANTKERAKRKCSFVVSILWHFSQPFFWLDFKLFWGSLKVVPSLTNRIGFLLYTCESVTLERFGRRVPDPLDCPATTWDSWKWAQEEEEEEESNKNGGDGPPPRRSRLMIPTAIWLLLLLLFNIARWLLFSLSLPTPVVDVYTVD